MSREWERALERQLALIEWFDTGSASMWLDMFTRMFRHRMAAEPLRKRIAATLGHADTFYVSEEIMKLVEVASSAEAIGEPVLEAHVPFTKMGFAYFQRPFVIPNLVLTDDNALLDTTMKVSAVLWSYEEDSVISVDPEQDPEIPVLRGGLGPGQRLGPGAAIWLFGADSQLDDYLEWLEGKGSPDSLLAGEPAAVEALRAHFGVGRFQHISGLDLIEASSWASHREWKELARDALEEASKDQEGWAAALESSAAVWFSQAAVRRFLFALWSLMAQPIAAPRSERPGRAYRRRWEQRVPAVPNYGDVRVVTLRRVVHGGGGEGPEEDFGPEWSHRWIVRGHWRKQWYASEGVHRLIWIAPFVKGPEDKPLIVKDSVFEVVR